MPVEGEAAQPASFTTSVSPRITDPKEPYAGKEVEALLEGLRRQEEGGPVDGLMIEECPQERKSICRDLHPKEEVITHRRR